MTLCVMSKQQKINLQRVEAIENIKSFEKETKRPTHINPEL